MGANIKQIKTRIKSVDSTLHITKAMQLVASSKIRHAQAANEGASAYASAMTEAVDRMISRENADSIFVSPPRTGVACCILIAGDRGLAGGYNSNVFRLCAEELKKGPHLFVPIGRRAADYAARNRLSLLTEAAYSSERFSEADAAALSELLLRAYRDCRFDTVKVIGTRIRSVLLQEPQVTVLLPRPMREDKSRDILYEPDAATVMGRAMPDYLVARLTASVRESFLSELFARRSAMDSASQNAEDMIEKLELLFNRARQSSITQEITEIVAGSEGQV